MQAMWRQVPTKFPTYSPGEPFTRSHTSFHHPRYHLERQYTPPRMQYKGSEGSKGSTLKPPQSASNAPVGERRRKFGAKANIVLGALLREQSADTSALLAESTVLAVALPADSKRAKPKDTAGALIETLGALRKSTFKAVGAYTTIEEAVAGTIERPASSLLAPSRCTTARRRETREPALVLGDRDAYWRVCHSHVAREKVWRRRDARTHGEAHCNTRGKR